jgi:hypothetical protein
MKRYLFLVMITITLFASNAYAEKHAAGTTCPPCPTADNGACQAPCGASDSVAERHLPKGDTKAIGLPQADPSIFDRWGNAKTKASCGTAGGVWSEAKGSCTGPRK